MRSLRRLVSQDVVVRSKLVDERELNCLRNASIAAACQIRRTYVNGEASVMHREETMTVMPLLASSDGDLVEVVSSLVPIYLLHATKNAKNFGLEALSASSGVRSEIRSKRPVFRWWQCAHVYLT